MSVGLLIDAFVVRTLLVPSIIALIGPVSAWPGRLRQPVAANPAPLSPAALAPAERSALARALLVVIGIGIAISALARRR